MATRRAPRRSNWNCANAIQKRDAYVPSRRTATDGVAVLDADGHSVAQPFGEALFGFDQNEVAGETVRQPDRSESHEALAQYFDGVK